MSLYFIQDAAEIASSLYIDLMRSKEKLKDARLYQFVGNKIANECITDKIVFVTPFDR